jgi:hypothetical protein
MSEPSRHLLAIYEDDEDQRPVVNWIRALRDRKRWTVVMAMDEYLPRFGAHICEEGEFGRQLGGGLFEFSVRVNPEEFAAIIGRFYPPTGSAVPHLQVCLKVFCHEQADGTVVSLAAYDCDEYPDMATYQAELATARRRLERLRAGRARIVV